MIHVKKMCFVHEVIKKKLSRRSSRFLSNQFTQKLDLIKETLTFKIF